MAWLIRDGQVLATVEVAETLGARFRGLIGRPALEGALLVRPARSWHTLGTRFAVDVAYCDPELVVLSVMTLRPYRLGVPRLRAGSVLAAPAGAFERWGLRPGDQLEVKG
jgi:uncharacterized membrane protein (UPF0127 family)